MAKVKILLKHENPFVAEEICELDLTDEQVQQLKQKLRRENVEEKETTKQ